MATKYASAPRLYVDAPLLAEEVITISESASHYLCSVMRLSEGDPVRLFNGEDGEYVALIATPHKKACILDVQTQLRPQKEDLPVSLAFAPLRKERLHFLIEKAVELGVTQLFPIITERTNYRGFNEGRALKHVIEATEQCERLTIAKVHPPLPLPKFLTTWPTEDPIFFCKERAGSEPLAQSLLNHHITSPTFLIGPEGGLSTEETLLLESYPFVNPVSLGYHILRSETAALSALGFWQLYQKAQNL